MKKKNKSKGFTVIEIILTFVIIALLVGIGIYSYTMIFSSSKESYYQSLESSLLEAGNSYFNDHREEISVSSISSVSVQQLVDEKYLEEVKDSSGNICSTGEVVIYKSDNKYEYEVCLKCEDYISKGSHCLKYNDLIKKVRIPTKEEYCRKNLVYNGKEQVLTNQSKEEFSFKNNKAIDANKYMVVASLNEGYIWEDDYYDDIHFECEINKLEITVKADNQSSISTSTLEADNSCSIKDGMLVDGHTLECLCSGNITSPGMEIKSLDQVIIKNGTKDVTNNYLITKVNGTLVVFCGENAIWNSETNKCECASSGYEMNDDETSCSKITCSSNEYWTEDGCVSNCKIVTVTGTDSTCEWHSNCSCQKKKIWCGICHYECNGPDANPDEQGRIGNGKGTLWYPKGSSHHLDVCSESKEVALAIESSERSYACHQEALRECTGHNTYHFSGLPTNTSGLKSYTPDVVEEEIDVCTFTYKREICE